MACPDTVKGQQLEPCVVPLAGYAIEKLTNDIVDHVANALGKAFCPQHVLFVDALSRARNTKVMRRAIPADPRRSADGRSVLAGTSGRRGGTACVARSRRGIAVIGTENA